MRSLWTIIECNPFLVQKVPFYDKRWPAGAVSSIFRQCQITIHICLYFRKFILLFPHYSQMVLNFIFLSLFPPSSPFPPFLPTLSFHSSLHHLRITAFYFPSTMRSIYLYLSSLRLWTVAWFIDLKANIHIQANTYHIVFFLALGYTLRIIFPQLYPFACDIYNFI